MMKNRSVSFRLFAGNLLLMGVMMTVSFMVSYTSLNAEYRRDDRLNQERLLRVLQFAIESAWPEPDESIDRRCKSLADELPHRLTVIAPDGRVLGDSEVDPLTMDNHNTPRYPEVVDALNGAPARYVRPSRQTHREFRYMAHPVVHDGQIVAAVRLAKQTRAIIEGRRFIGRALLLSALAAVCVASGSAMLISWLWARPLREITRTAGRIAAGDLGAKAVMHGGRELSQLAEALNGMRVSLASQIDTIADHRENLQTVMANLREGVIALDGDRRIVLFNQAAAELLGLDPHSHVGEHFQAVVREPAVVDLLDSLTEETAAAAQVQVRAGHFRRTVHAHAARVAAIRQDAIRMLLVLRDITDIDRMATIKAEFVANASHELRTPLATIRVALDSLATMDGGAPDAFTRHIEILDRHVTRLEAMTRDLLDLHLVEQTQAPKRQEQIDPQELLQWVRGHFAARADDASVRLLAEIDGELPAIRCDRRLLQLIIRNLVDNAIKFTPAEGTVACRLRQADGRVLVTVSDNGCGIPPELHNRIFERFFQADAARAGDPAKRGTGLGLAIVKYAAERMGATIDLESVPGEGAAFTVSIPTAQTS